MIFTIFTDLLICYSKCGTTNISDAANIILNAKPKDMNGVYFAGCYGFATRTTYCAISFGVSVVL